MTTTAPLTHEPAGADGPDLSADHTDEHACGSCSSPSRRAVLRGAGMVTLGAAAATVLAACGGSSSPTTPAPGAGSAAGGSSGGSGAAGALAQLADIPVGGAISATSADGKPIIIAQPVAGTVVGLSAICTHQGCTVAPADTTLNCPCHGSEFALADGAVLKGPATKPLPSFPVRVDGAAVVAG